MLNKMARISPHISWPLFIFSDGIYIYKKKGAHEPSVAAVVTGAGVEGDAGVMVGNSKAELLEVAAEFVLESLKQTNLILPEEHFIDVLKFHLSTCHDDASNSMVVVAKPLKSPVDLLGKVLRRGVNALDTNPGCLRELLGEGIAAAAVAATLVVVKRLHDVLSVHLLIARERGFQLRHVVGA
eukprot:TRINITY_DN79_c0_g1_i1.p2 TRINITY_DN79_c0_g1~~TRINITY_DN79_c0_g1_i1.p2  ORF type:complete len:183 (-),score=5.84 TRINITY_DN79_c0_g1_i1:678-1226(-)